MSKNNNSEIISVADIALEQLGFEQNTDSRYADRQKNMNYVGVQNMPGDTDALLSWYDDTNDKTAIHLHDLAYQQPFLFRGLFRLQSARLHLPGRGTFVDAILVNSPSAVNAAQVALGRTPGTDAFELVRTPEATTFTAGDWVEGFGKLQVPVAGYKSGVMAEHDLTPNDHLQSWLSTPPGFCLRIAARARRLKKVHGDRIHAEEDDVPKAVRRFVGALDSLSDVTKPLFSKTITVGQTMSVASLPTDKAWGAIWNHTLQWIGVKFIGDVMQNAGIINSKLEGASLERSVVDAGKAYVAHMARLLLSLEEVRPLQDDNRKQRVNRIRVLSTIKGIDPGTIAV